MKKNVIALECSTSSVKIAVGYELDGEVIVNYAAKKDLPDGVILGCEIGDEEYLSKQIVELIQDAKKNLKIDAFEVNLLLPPMDYEVYINNQSTNVVSEVGIIADTDIRNVEMLMTRGEYGSLNNVVIDIIPQYYKLDDDRAFLTPPKGEVSAILGMRAFVHVLPSTIRDRFHEVVRHAGLKVAHSSVSPFGATKLLDSPSYKESLSLPNNYCLVDYGSKYTVATLISKGAPVRSTYFELGSRDLTNLIASRFQISFEEAEKLKCLYGLDESSHTYHPTICKSKDIDGKITRYSILDLNVVIKEHLDQWSKDLERAIRAMIHDEREQLFPMLLIGGGSSLNGLVPYLNGKNLSVQRLVVKNIGARDTIYTSTLGMLKIASLKQAIDQNDDRRALNLTRKSEPQKVVKKDVKRRYSDTDDIL